MSSSIPSNILRLNATEDTFTIGSAEFTLIDFVEKVMAYEHSRCGRLFETIDINYIVKLMDKEKLQEIEKRFAEIGGSKSIGILTFVTTMLQAIDHYEEETLYLTLGLIDLFKGISESLNMATTFKFQDITTAICERVANSFLDEYQVVTRVYPPLKRFQSDTKPEFSSQKAALIEAPIVYENNQHSQLKRLRKGKFKTDSTDHRGRKIKQYKDYLYFAEAFFAKEIKRVITLDSLDQKISMYNLDCEQVQEINVKNKEDDAKMEIIIFGIAWSEKQQRIGAVLKNYTLSFWEEASRFQFEKNFSVHGYTQDYQSSIWYLETYDMWITTDSHHHIHCWDIANETTMFSLQRTNITNSIFNIAELPALKLVAVGSLDKKISIWNFHTQTMLMTIQFQQVKHYHFSDSSDYCFQVGVHSFAFSNEFQVLVTAGYENNVCLYSIDSESQDSTQLGKLRGHTSMISCVCVMEGTPMVVSGDDNGMIRVWDIRNQSCIQTFECSSSSSLNSSQAQKIHIHLILDMFCQGIVGLIGSRLNLIEFDEKENIVKEMHSTEPQIPLSVEANLARNEISVCTRQQVRFYDISSGRCKFVFNGLLENEQDEITVFKPIQQCQKFLLGNSRGQISLHSYEQNGQRIGFLQSHANEVTHFKVDVQNKLLISSAWDSAIRIQALEDKVEEKTMRSIEHAHFEKGVCLLEVSVYHNVVFSATTNIGKVFVYDYEYGRLLNYIEFNENTEPTAICSIQGYPMVAIATSDKKIYVIHFTKKDNVIKFELLACLNTTVSQQFLSNPSDFSMATSIQPSPSPKKNQVFFNSAVFLTQKQQDEMVDTKNHLNNQSSKPSRVGNLQQVTSPHKLSQKSDKRGGQSAVSSKRIAEIVAQEDQQDSSSVDESRSVHHNYTQDAVSVHEHDSNQNGTGAITHLLPDFSFNSANTLDCARLFCTNNKGQLLQFDLLPVFQHHNAIQFVDHANTRLNYNPHRSSTEDFRQAMSKFSAKSCFFSESTPISTTFTSSSKSSPAEIQQLVSSFTYKLLTKSIQAHKDAITSVHFVTSDNDDIVTSSADSYVRIWKKHDLQQICSLNINHPLPIQWDYTPNRVSANQKKVLYAIRILDIINKKHTEESNRKDESSTRVIPFIKKLMKIKGSKSINDDHIANKAQSLSTQEDLQPTSAREKLVMSSYYNPRDIKFDEIKHLFRQELLGMSLKRMEVNKRVAIAQQIWKKQPVSIEDHQRNQMKKLMEIQARGDERETITNFLDPNYRQYLLLNAAGPAAYQMEEEYSESTKNLSLKLDYFSRQARKSMFLVGDNSLALNQNNNHHHTSNNNMNTSTGGIYNSHNANNKFPQSKKSSRHLILPGITTPQAQSVMGQTIFSSRRSIEVPASDHKAYSQMASPQSVFESPKYPKQVKQEKYFKSSKNTTQQSGSLHQQLNQDRPIGTPNNSATGVALSVKEPPNFDKLIRANQNKINHRLTSLSDLRGRGDLKESKNMTASQMQMKEKKSQDVYVYAREKNIIPLDGNSMSIADSIHTQATSTLSQMGNTSMSKLNTILSGLETKLKYSKRSHNTSNSNANNPIINNSTMNVTNMTTKPFKPVGKPQAKFFDQKYFEKLIP